MEPKDSRSSVGHNARRRFLQRLGLAGGAAVAAGIAPSGAASAPDGHWDRTVDIICVGGGAAGCTASVTAAHHDAQVLLLEKEPRIGGTTMKSGGIAWIPNNFLLREAGERDDKQDCLQYLCRFAYPHLYVPHSPTMGLDESSFRALEAFYDTGQVMVDFLSRIGAARFGVFSVGAGGARPPDYGDHLLENKRPKGRSLAPLDADGKPVPGRIGDGSALINALSAWLAENKVPVLTGHRVTRLIQERGRVVGVEAQHEGRKLRLRARQGVIFATGGFAHNTEYVRLYHKFLYGACAMPASTGDFVSIGAMVGARMANMGSAWRAEVVLEEALASRLMPQDVFFVPGDSMLIVNKYGNRVVNEKRNYNDRTKVHYIYDPVNEDYPNQLLFLIFDERTCDAYAGAYPLPADAASLGYTLKGDTLADLSAKLHARLSTLADKTGGAALSADFADKLRVTIERFNGFARSGVDLDFGRGQQAYDREWQGFFSALRPGTAFGPNTMPSLTMHPLRDKGPYYVVILGAGALDTNGGPVINAHGQVISGEGAPIAGLYGAGNCIACPSAEAYYGAGGTIGLAMTFGYLAALDAMQRASPTAAVRAAG